MHCLVVKGDTHTFTVEHDLNTRRALHTLCRITWGYLHSNVLLYYCLVRRSQTPVTDCTIDTMYWRVVGTLRRTADASSCHATNVCGTVKISRETELKCGTGGVAWRGATQRVVWREREYDKRTGKGWRLCWKLSFTALGIKTLCCTLVLMFSNAVVIFLK